jgi:hypothetical protein
MPSDDDDRDAAWDDDDGPDAGDLPSLGTCCICGGDRRVRTIIMLEVKGAVPGHGWGCFACNLPMDGASAVLCDQCARGWQSGAVKLQWACAGYPGEDGRVPIAELTVPHKHDPEVEH